MTPQQAQQVAARMMDSGYIDATEELSALRTVGTDEWTIYIRGEIGKETIRTPEDWTRIATERGAARNRGHA